MVLNNSNNSNSSSNGKSLIESFMLEGMHKSRNVNADNTKNILVFAYLYFSKDGYGPQNAFFAPGIYQSGVYNTSYELNLISGDENLTSDRGNYLTVYRSYNSNILEVSNRTDYSCYVELYYI